MKIQEMGLFHTPENAKEIHDYIESLSGSERQVGWVVYGLFNNLIARELKRAEALSKETIHWYDMPGSESQGA